MNKIPEIGELNFIEKGKRAGTPFLVIPIH